MRAYSLANDLVTLAYPATDSAGTGAITVTQTTGAVTGTTHLLVLGDTVTFLATQSSIVAPPAPLLPGVEYWVVPVSTSAFKLATSYANAVAGTFIVTTGSTVTAAAYDVNHYVLFPSSQFSNGLSPYVELEDNLENPALFVGSGVPIVNYTGVTATSASPAVFTLPSGSIANGRAVKLGGAVPGGFTANKVYYVVATSGSTFELALTVGGAAINSTSAGGSITVYDVTGMQLGTAEISGETGDVTAAPGVPFLEGYTAILTLGGAFLASNSVTLFVEGASDVAGGYNNLALNDVPGAWTQIGASIGYKGLTAAAAANAQTGVGSVPPQWFQIQLPQYVRVRVNALIESINGPGSSAATVSKVSAALLGN